MSALFLKVPLRGDVERLGEVNRHPPNRVNRVNCSHHMLQSDRARRGLRLNSYSRSVQSKGTPIGTYLAHPSIKAEAKVGKQVHDSFSKLVTLTYLLVLSSSSYALPRHPIF